MIAHEVGEVGGVGPGRSFKCLECSHGHVGAEGKAVHEVVGEHVVWRWTWENSSGS